MRTEDPQTVVRRRPDWLKVRVPAGGGFDEVRALLADLSLHTVCQGARCPNIGECWGQRTATFMILGNVCTRNCRFCAVPTGRCETPDEAEPLRVAEAVRRLGLRYAVITSVTRDDLPDGGASVFAEMVREIRERQPGCAVEVLIPDFQGNWDALATVVSAAPEVLNHNLETVERLYPSVRPQANYQRSLELLARAKEFSPALLTKSGLMVGLGERVEEVQHAVRHLREVGCELLTIGQYLRPSLQHAPVARYYFPQEFEDLSVFAMNLGFRHVESGPLVRSSYHAKRQVEEVRDRWPGKK